MNKKHRNANILFFRQNKDMLSFVILYIKNVKQKLQNITFGKSEKRFDFFKKNNDKIFQNSQKNTYFGHVFFQYFIAE